MTEAIRKPRLNPDDRDFLQRLVNGWQPLCIQAGQIGARLEKRNFVRRDWGIQDGKTDKLCWFVTDAGRSAIL